MLPAVDCEMSTEADMLLLLYPIPPDWQNAIDR